jgi:MFS family permease
LSHVVGRLPGLWRNRDFMLLWTGQVVSTVGIRITLLAYPLLILAQTGSPAAAGVVGFAQTLPFLIWYLPAGALVDRWDRKKVMLIADAIRAITLASVVGALLLDRLTLPQILVAAFVEGTMFVFFQLAEDTALPHVVPRSQLPAALAQNQARVQGAELAGQPLGGVLFGIGHAVPFLVNVISYAVSVATLLLIRTPFQGRRDEQRRHLLAELAFGLTWLWRQRFLRVMVGLIGAANLVFNALTIVIIVRAQQLGASPALIGGIFACQGAGAIAGALAAPVVARRVPNVVVIVGAFWLWAAVFGALAVPSDPLALGAIALCGAMAGPAFNVVVSNYRYALTPDHLQGRTLGAGRLVAWGTIPVGPLAGGLMVEAIGARNTFLVLAAAMALVALASTASGTVRRPPAMPAGESVDVQPSRLTAEDGH